MQWQAAPRLRFDVFSHRQYKANARVTKHRLERKELERAVALLEGGDWQAAHKIVQRDEESTLACWAHGIVHLMEGDTANARYWFRKAKRTFPLRPSAPEEIRALRAELRGR